MKFKRATAEYEQWLRRRLRVIEADLAAKHLAMRSAPFPFLRATYYRWAQIWEKVCGAAARGPKVLAVGDLHVENFGTWRDVEGRLVWGINDFDEAWPMAYTNDLIRLATSAILAEMTCDGKAGVAAILKGYADGLAAGGRPFTLAEHHPALREMAVHRLHDPQKFWDKLHALEDALDAPKSATKAIDRLMPERRLKWRVVHRIAGLGSLGRERYVALVDWHGASVAREAKALAPSACVWAKEGGGTAPILYQKIVDGAVRSVDPFVHLEKGWIVRRLAPDCSRIELSALPEERDEIRLLHAMGFETANVHLGSAKANALATDLTKRPAGWLYRAAREMEKAVRADFAEWAGGAGVSEAA
jgi:hypothetical protein